MMSFKTVAECATVETEERRICVEHLCRVRSYNELLRFANWLIPFNDYGK